MMAFLMIVHVPFEPTEESSLKVSTDTSVELQDADDETASPPGEDTAETKLSDDGESKPSVQEPDEDTVKELDNSKTTEETTNGAIEAANNAIGKPNNTEDIANKNEDIANNAVDKANNAIENAVDNVDKATKDVDVDKSEHPNEKTIKEDLNDDVQAATNTSSDHSKDNKDTTDEVVAVKQEMDPSPDDEVKGTIDTEAKDDATEEKTNEDTATSELDNKTESSVSDTDNSSMKSSPEKLEPMSPGTIANLVPLVVKVPLYQEVENLLMTEVRNLERTLVGDMKFMRFSFIEDDSKQCENILNKLKAIGVGFVAETSISIFPSSVHESGTDNLASVSSDKSLEELPGEESFQDDQKENVFKKSIKSRLVVAQVISSVRGGAMFTFDFLLLVLLASIISCVGLAESSSVVLVASMLISPLMGPILAGTFGQVVKMKDLRNLGLRSELLGLSLCVLVGFVIGLVTGGIGLHGAIWGSSDQWPTPEMKSRGMVRSLWVGILIALPSGAGVAISVLSANAGSLVGVAISASLLPPACNAGMLWGYALLAAISPPEVVASVIPFTSTMATPTSGSTENVTFLYLAANITNTTDLPRLVPEVTPTGALDCPALVRNAYTPVYSCNMAVDAVILGSVSLLLTIVNIICIFLVGIVFLKIKEVAPHTAGKEKATDHFWHEDVKVARTYYETRKGAGSTVLGKQFLEEWKKIKSRKDSMSEGAETIEMCQYLVGMQNSPQVQNLLSKLNTPTSDLMDDLQSEFDKAKTRLQEEIVKHPGFLLSNTTLKSKDQKFMRAYHTLSAAAPETEKPSLFELRKRFRKMGGVQSMFIVTEDEAASAATPYLSEPVESNLGKRRQQKKEKTVKFDVQRVDEEQPLIIS